LDFVKELNEPQRAAVTHIRGPLLVLAGAGSGKTRVITYRIAHILDSGVHPSEILALTFTNKAAREMRERAETLVGSHARGLLIGTFHAICARLLRQYGSAIGLSSAFTIYDTGDQRTLVKRVLRDLSIPERLLGPKDVLSHLDRAKNAGITAARYEGDDFVSDLVAKVYPRYERALREADAVDFGNLLLRTLELLEEHREVRELLAKRFHHVLVDEFQDTNHVQYKLVRLLSGHHGNLCVVGDDDQSIYGWRGADVRNILDFERDHPRAEAVKLEQNYRSTQKILDAANAVISKLLGRKQKRLWTNLGAGEKIVLQSCSDERHEAQQLAETVHKLRVTSDLTFSDFAIFYRTHAQSRVIEEALRKVGIPHAVVGGVRFYDRAEIKDLLAYLRLAANSADDVSFLRIVNTPPRGIGKSTIQTVVDYASNAHVTLIEAAQRCARGEGLTTPLKKAPRTKLNAFCELIADLAQNINTLPPSELAQVTLERSGYLERLAADDSVEAETRTENLTEVLSSLQDYERQAEEPTLHGFLEQVALQSEADTYDEETGTVTLMTVHSAKGLEFPVVFLVGLEDGVFPHQRSLNDPERMEEERRLAYVAITRARQRLFLSYAQRRQIYGQTDVNPPSIFLSDIPEKLLDRRGRAPRGMEPQFGGLRGLGPRGRLRRWLVTIDAGFRREEGRCHGTRADDADDAADTNAASPDAPPESRHLGRLQLRSEHGHPHPLPRRHEGGPQEIRRGQGHSRYGACAQAEPDHPLPRRTIRADFVQVA